MEGLPSTTDRDYLAEAGRTLHLIQVHGLNWSTETSGKLDWWDEDPLAVHARVYSSPETEALHNTDRSSLVDAMQIISEGEQTVGPWLYTHCDHKPENSLRVENCPAIIDWDECGHCHPRLETVKAALRWSGTEDPNREAFVAFLDGYSKSGGTIAGLVEQDFAKWVAAIVGWFAFQARRALGDWPEDTPDERKAALDMSINAYASLQPTLSRISTWTSWYP
jgi:aminoglycoside phosphotransferase (APT) family kinase protein